MTTLEKQLTEVLRSIVSRTYTGTGPIQKELLEGIRQDAQKVLELAKSQDTEGNALRSAEESAWQEYERLHRLWMNTPTRSPQAEQIRKDLREAREKYCRAKEAANPGMLVM